MGVLRSISGAVLALAVFGDTRGGEAADAALKRELQVVAARQVFFGHQSVGNNLLEGIGDLASKLGVPLRIVRVEGESTIASATLNHAGVAENGHPEMKLANFVRALDAGPASGPEVAFLKLCYDDISERTDVTQLFAEYRRTFSALAAKYSATAFVHVTVPLTTIQGGLKAAVKRLLGRAPYGFLQNARREEFNRLMRSTFQGREPLYNLAALESMGPNGSRATYTWQGREVPVLVAGYAADNGHLNETGRIRAARELIRVLATATPPPRGVVETK